MILDNFMLYNDEGELIYDGNLYSGNYIIKRKENSIHNKNDRKIVTIVLLSCVPTGLPGKTCLINTLIEGKFIDSFEGTLGISHKFYSYNYNRVKYNIFFYDTSGREKYRSMNLAYVKRSNIVIYLFELSEDNEIKESFIDEIIEHTNQNIKIYLIGNKIDIDTARLNIEKYRKQAKILIDRGKINKYFELSVRTGEGMEFFKKIIEIDSAIISDECQPNIELKIIKKIDEFNKLNKLKKYINI